MSRSCPQLPMPPAQHRFCRVSPVVYRLSPVYHLEDTHPRWHLPSPGALRKPLLGLLLQHPNLLERAPALQHLSKKWLPLKTLLLDVSLEAAKVQFRVLIHRTPNQLQIPVLLVDARDSQCHVNLPR
uniref:Uncharacterized protein n=1 Tax=Cacopsylla melanoneura TaxID=428564 RepID=A0A8D8YPD4_9HEMI